MEKGQRVTARVEGVFPFGIFVCLEDGESTRAYIRRRELTLAGDQNPRDVVSEGQALAAVVVSLASPGKMAELSVRLLLPDPWETFSKHFHPGTVVQAVVKDLTQERVYVQIQPGVDGWIPCEELAGWPDERPEDILWAGDQVEAVIIQVDLAGRRVVLSIRRRVEQLLKADRIAGELLHQEDLEPVSAAPEKAVSPAPAYPPVHLPAAVLVLEDHEEVRLPLVRWLQSLECDTVGFGDALAALAYLEDHPCALALVDLEMQGMDGLGFLAQVRTREWDFPTAAMSGPEGLAQNMEKLQALKVAAVFSKPLLLEEIYHFLEQVSRREFSTARVPEQVDVLPVELQPFQRLSGILRSSTSLPERLRSGLQQLARDTGAEMGIVFAMDPASSSISIVAASGTLPLVSDAVYGLVNSPVRDVIQEERVIWENEVSAGRQAQFRKLLDLLPFESCIGVPLQAGGQTRHALFLFHRLGNAFSRYRLRDTLAVAALFNMALESHLFEDRLQSMSRILLSGQLAAAFSHEVYNKLSGLDLQFNNLQNDLSRMANLPGTESSAQSYQQLQEATTRAIETAASLKQVVEGFRRLMESRQDQVFEVNQVIQQAELQVRPLARRAQVAIQLDLAGDLPGVAGSPVGLYQAALNLMLNAIQHIELSQTARRLVTVQTLFQVGSSYPVQLRFSDSGPGIHHSRWEEIFNLGNTTRPGGSGLGLYIARSLVESMGGRLSVVESRILLGAVFLIELPAWQSEGQ